jgi:hypothetical protein
VDLYATPAAEFAQMTSAPKLVTAVAMWFVLVAARPRRRYRSICSRSPPRSWLYLDSF